MSNKVVEMIKSLPEVKLDYWKNVLRVDTDRIRNALNNPESGTLETLLKKIISSGEEVLNVFGELFELENDVKTGVQIRTEIILKHTESKYLLNILLCQELLNNKNDSARKEVFKKFLDGRTDVLGTLNNKHLFQCILLMFIDWKKLVYYILFDSHEKAAMKQYVLIPNEEESGFEKTQKALRDGMNIEKYLKEDDLNKILENFEKREDSGGTSRCLGVLSDLDSITVFVQRSYKPANIIEQETTIFGNETKIVIMVFSKDGKILNQHSVQKDSIQLANFLISNVYNLRLRYVENSATNQIDTFKNVLNVLLEGRDELIDLTSLEYRNFGVDGHPTIKIIKAHTTPLAETIKDFEVKGFDVLNTLGNIVTIKLSFKMNNDDASNTITLNLQVSENGIILYYFNNHLSKLKTNYFHLYMKDEHGIIVIPDAANQKNAKQ